MDKIKKLLMEHADLKYKEFTSRIVPNIPKDKILGVRMPLLRQIAKEIKDDDYVDTFLKEFPHQYQEENILHGILLPLKYKDIDLLLYQLDLFLPYADNWAITDVISPKLFKKYPDIVYEKIKIWVHSEYEYVIRFGVVSLLQFYLDDAFRLEELELVSQIQNDSYYILMAIAWFYSMALVKQYDSTIPYFENRVLNRWTHNKSIQKAIESYRIPSDRKEYLRSLKY